jgi:amino acid permease|eukprot:1266369-Prymnesium_polylepis.1
MLTIFAGSARKAPLLDEPERAAVGSKGASASGALANLLKSMIGSGILTLPWATAQVGILPSVIGLVIIAYLSERAIRLLVLCVAYKPWERKTLIDSLRASQVCAATASCSLSSCITSLTARACIADDIRDTAANELRDTAAN